MSELTAAPAATADLAVEVLQRNAAEFLDHAPGARAGTDPHHVHQMRVATRRMRAAVRLFADVLPAQATRLNAELKWFAGQLGPVRDLDVQRQRVRATVQALALEKPLAVYADWLEDQHQRARKHLADGFETRRFGSLVQDLQRLDSWPLRDSPPVVLEAPRRLRHAYARLRTRADAVDARTSTADLHKLRILAKRLRYTAEFFEPLYGKPAKRVVERVVALQDLLGNLQDGVVSRQHVYDAIGSSGDGWPPPTALALGQLVQFEAEREQEVRAAFPDTYHRALDAWKALRHEVPKTAD